MPIHHRANTFGCGRRPRCGLRASVFSTLQCLASV